jgi:cytidyltransferase-like protein
MVVVSFPDLIDLPLGAVVAVGNFDGVHAGHRELLRVAKGEAERLRVPLVVLTFEPHPRTVLFPDKPLQRLRELDEKVALLSTFCLSSCRLPTISCPSTSTTVTPFCFDVWKLMNGSAVR